MPNHITNELVAPPHVLDYMKGPGEQEFDFNRVVQMPEILDSGSSKPMISDWAKLALGHYPLSYLDGRGTTPLSGPEMADKFEENDYGAVADNLQRSNVLRMLNEGPYPKDFSDEDFRHFLQYMEALRLYGETTWYEWCPKHWGTKWNAYDIKRIDETTIRFDTAWSAPFPVIDALSRKFPDATLYLRWADEDFGYNVGNVAIVNGEVVEGANLEGGSIAAKELALELKYGGELPDHMRREPDGDIVYVEDDES